MLRYAQNYQTVLQNNEQNQLDIEIQNGNIVIQMLRDGYQ